jgi:HAD superfamily hydrolase (TIGR01509 family)
MNQLKAVIFGAIGTIAETSDLQRQAFNAAFAAAEISWHWDQETYRKLLRVNGGQHRLRTYRDTFVSQSSALISDEMISDLHRSKTDYFGKLLQETSLSPRSGVIEMVEACAKAKVTIALCTSTSIDNVNAIGMALSGSLPFARFAQIVTIEQIAKAKPAPDAYLYCLNQLGFKADEVVAIEDTPVSIASAQAAGIFTVATPGVTTAEQDFSSANLVIADLNTITIESLSLLLN